MSASLLSELHCPYPLCCHVEVRVEDSLTVVRASLPGEENVEGHLVGNCLNRARSPFLRIDLCEKECVPVGDPDPLEESRLEAANGLPLLEFPAHEYRAPSARTLLPPMSPCRVCKSTLCELTAPERTALLSRERSAPGRIPIRPDDPDGRSADDAVLGPT